MSRLNEFGHRGEEPAAGAAGAGAAGADAAAEQKKDK